MYPRRAVWPRRIARFGAVGLVGSAATAMAYEPDVVDAWVSTPTYWIMMATLGCVLFSSLAFFHAIQPDLPKQFGGDFIDRLLYRLGKWLD